MNRQLDVDRKASREVVQRLSEASESDHALALVGIAATMLEPDRIHDSVDEVLELVRSTVGSDSIELFLLDPRGEEVVLTAYQGDGPEAFMTRCRFMRGVGFPGVAISTGAPVHTSRLQSDEQFLRSKVKDEGYRSFIAVPIGGAECVGTVNLAWRRGDVDFTWVTRLVTWLGKPLGNALLAAATRSARRWEHEGAGIHERFSSLCDADEVTLVAVSPFSLEERSSIPWDSFRVDCPRVRREGLVIMERPTDWSRECSESCGVSRACCCIPLTHEDDTIGVVRLSYHHSRPSPVTRHVAASMALAASYVKETYARAHGPRVSVEPPRPLELRLFGVFGVYVDGELLPRSAFSRKKAIELLALLALGRDRRLSKAQLIRLLWPEVDMDAATNRLYGVVHALRNSIEPKSAARGRTYIDSEEGFYGLNANAPLWVDLWEYRRLLSQARRASFAADSPREIARLLRRAVDLYCGELLADFPDAIWTIDPRSRCREECVNALLQLHNLQREIGTPDESIRLLRAAAAVDPLREDVHGALIQALRDLGREHDAVAHARARARARSLE